MKKFNILFILLFSFFVGFSLEQDASQQIRDVRNKKLDDLNSQETHVDSTIQSSQQKLDETDVANLKKRLQALDEVNKEQGAKLDLIEKSKVIGIQHNGAIAFAELLNVDRDMKPATLFLAAQAFFNQLSDAGNISKYSAYTSWQKEFMKWYDKKKGTDALLDVIGSSVNLVGNIANKVPMYGSIVNTVCSGITAVINSVGGAGKDLKNQTAKVLPVMNAVGQFANQKAIIDNEWVSIAQDLDDLAKEQNTLVKEQITYYGLSKNDYDNEWVTATTYADRDKYIKKTSEFILAKIDTLSSPDSKKNDWSKKVQGFMYRVQSLRVRFGQLAIRMQANLKAYEQLLAVFSDSSQFPQELISKINGLTKPLQATKDAFDSNFRPQKYIQDSAVMYIE